MPKLHSYVVARDYGFAPNPFYGFCTLATCKPMIRKTAQIGDWVVGTGSKTRGRESNIVYAMRVTETMSFDQYWKDPRFQSKKPYLRGSKKQAFGDNIYHRDSKTRHWHQEDSHHSHPDGTPNKGNIANDTQADRVLISDDFVYWGGGGPKLLKKLRNHNGLDICGKRGHKNAFPDKMIEEFIVWLRSLGQKGYCGEPLDWERSP
jgi:hypothetical protein